MTGFSVDERHRLQIKQEGRFIDIRLYEWKDEEWTPTVQGVRFPMRQLFAFMEMLRLFLR